MINLLVDNNLIEVAEKTSIIEVCESLGIIIPRFCYHEILSVAGNCRMCVVEVDTVEKPVASCATEAKEGMDIFTNNSFVKKARENVVEMLLLNHPLDCPICDQAGECDLQDQVKAYGSSQTKFYGLKKTTEDKLCNPFIKTIMTRCITCTRCVRYASEVAGVEYFGTLNRGTNTEIGSYAPDTMFFSEISANVVDLCPVGALTSAPYAFHGRPWELKSTESIDTSDSLGSNIYINHKENIIYRVLPKNRIEINHSIISDVARFSFEHTRKNRMLHVTKNEEKSQLINITKDIIYKEVYSVLKSKKKINFIIDENIDLDTLIYLNYLKKSGKYNLVLNQKTSLTSNNLIINEKFSISKLFKLTNKFFFLIGVNLRMENAVLNSKLRFKYRTTDLQIFTSGFNYISNIPNQLLFLSIDNILTSFEGLYNKLSYNFLKTKDTTLIFGTNFFQRFKNYYTAKSLFKKMTNSHKTMELYNDSNSELTKMFQIKSITNKIKSKSSLYLNLKDDTVLRRIINSHNKNKKNDITVWVNTNSSDISRKANYNFPSKSYFEDEFHFVSLGYRHQKTNKTGELQPGIKKISNVLSKLISSRKKIRSSNFILNTLLEDNENLELDDSNMNLYLSPNETSFFQKYPMKHESRNFYEHSRFTQNSNSLRAASSSFEFFYKNF